MSSSQTLNAFDHAIAQHSRWKRKFREQLATGSALPTEISADDSCALGRWIYGEGKKYSALLDYRNLKQAHAQFHLDAAELIRRAQAGEPVADEIAPCSQSNYSLSSSAVVIAIKDLQRLIS